MNGEIIDWNNCHTSDQLESISAHKNDLAVEKTEVRKPCINYEDGCEEWAGCPCVYYKCRNEG